jgi:hypothetical protein
MKRIWLFTWTLVFWVPAILMADRLTVSGYITDRSSGETIIGVNIIIQGSTRGTASDVNGYFILTGLLPGEYKLEFSHIAYKKKTISILLKNMSQILPEIALEPKILEMQDVSIVAQKSELADLSLETGYRAITSEAIRRIPTSRDDVFRAIKHLPGIESIDPFSPLYVVRGSDSGENLILLDGVPIYNPYHYVSASGLFNVYALKNIELMVGGFGTEFGGRTGSVLYITTREGNSQQLHGEISPGTTYTNGVIDFPIGQNATMLISGRWYYNLFSLFLFDMPSYFYDMNSTITWKPGKRNRLTFRYFHSFDNVDFKSDTYFNYLRNTFDLDVLDDYDFVLYTQWRNQAVSAQLKTIISPSVYWQTQIYRSSFSANNRSLIDFEYLNDDDRKIQLFMDTNILARICDTGIHTKLNVRLWSWNLLKIGGEYNQYQFRNEVMLNSYSEGKLKNSPSLKAVYLEDKADIYRLSLRPGIRLTQMGNNDWHSEYRINMAWSLTHRLKLKAAWGNYFQYIVSINTQEYELSQYLDTYYPLANGLPAASSQLIFGVETDLHENLQVSVDGYYKEIVRTYGYDYNTSQLEAITTQDKLRQGQGKAYGLELLLKGNFGKTSGWISYGWSHSTRTFPHIMQGRSHLFDYDRPHAFKSVLNYQLNPAIEFSTSLNILSGMPKTMETGYANYYYYDPLTNDIGAWPHVITPVKNNIRMPWLLNLDFSIKKRIRTGFGADLARYLKADKAYLNVTISDLLFAVHRNVWFYIRDDDNLYGVGTNYFPIINFGYSIQF